MAPSAARLYPRQAAQQYERDDPAPVPWVQPFDMPMAHVEVGRAGCSPMDTEVAVFVPTDDEVTPSLWRRFEQGQEDDLEAKDSATHIVVARAVPRGRQALDPMRLTCGRFSYEGHGIQDATSVMIEYEHMVITHDCAAACHGLDFGDARLHALPSSPIARALFDDSKVVGQEGRHRPWMQRYDLADKKQEYAAQMSDLEKRAWGSGMAVSSSVGASVATCESGTSKRGRDGNAVMMGHADTVMEVDEAKEEEVQVTAVLCDDGSTEEAIPGSRRSNLRANKRSRGAGSVVVSAVGAPGAEKPSQAVAVTGTEAVCDTSADAD